MGNRLMACALTQRRNHGPRLENPGFSACHGVFRARRTVFLRHATGHGLDQQNADLGANTTLDRFLTTLSFARTIRRAPSSRSQQSLWRDIWRQLAIFV